MAEEKKEETKFSLMKLIPVTVLVSLLSQTSILFYYHCFNFSPISYFDPYELVVSSAKDFFIIGIFIIFYHQIIHLYVLPLLEKKVYPQIDSISEKKKNSNINYHLNGIWISISFLLLLSVGVSYMDLKSHEKSMVLIGLTWCIILLLIIAIKERYEELVLRNNHRSQTVRKNYIYMDTRIIIAMSMLFMFCILLSYGKFNYMKFKNPYKGTLLITDENEAIKCTSKVLFIGKSQKFYFLFNTPDSSIRVIEREKLKKEVIKIGADVPFMYRF